MKRIFALYVSVATVVLMSACGTSAVDEGTGGSEPVVEQLSSVPGGGFTTATPDGLAAPIPAGKFVDRSYVGDASEPVGGGEGILACHVDLLFCRDSRFGNLPSGCTNGGCTVTQAHNAAVSLCKSVCGNINCNVIAWPPGCL